MHWADHAHLLDHQSDQVDDGNCWAAAGAAGPAVGERLCLYDLRSYGLLLRAGEEGDRHPG